MEDHTTPQCCACHGHAPNFQCPCSCHQAKADCEYWETAAYVWLYDAPNAKARQAAWDRFVVAFPEHAKETMTAFWERIQKTKWYALNKQHYKHRHQEYEDDWDDEYSDATGEHEHTHEDQEEYDENEDNGIDTTDYSHTVEDDYINIGAGVDAGISNTDRVVDTVEECDTEVGDDPETEHKHHRHHHEEESEQDLNEPLSPDSDKK